MFDPEKIAGKESEPRPGTPEASLDKYLRRTIRRVTLFFPQVEYDAVITEAKIAMALSGAENHSDLFSFLLREFLERHQKTS